jgi:cystathionine beta-lyase family protein involved in aluminum resistance
MMQELYDMMQSKFGISEKVLQYCIQKECELKKQFQSVDEITEYNQLKVLSAMQKNKLSDIHFAATTGYGYNDLGRDVLENIYADVFQTESGLVRPQLISGTHALTVALAGNLRPGDELLSPVGIPYDTLQGVIGIRKEKGSLSEYGITYQQVDLLPGDKFDFDGIEKAINNKTKLVTIQRSKGYQWRVSFSVSQIKELISFIKSINKNIICMVDNCYGEFVEIQEPSEVGADLVVGSLIKNPGGGLAPIGGYIVGKEEFVENAAYRLTAPGLGKEVGATLGVTPSFVQGLFMAPQVVNGSIKTAMFASKLFEDIGFAVLPKSNEKRADIVQLIQMNTAENVIAFCQGIQKGAPVDSYVSPEPWDMPGYDCPVIMAAGAFVQGSSIELSADAPIKPPYHVYMQGGLSWHHGKIGVMIGLQTMVDKGLIQIS